VKSIVLTLIIALIAIPINAQVGIGTVSPDSSATLDITDDDGGILIPRVALSDVTDGTSPINTPATSLLVYNTNASVTGGNGEGFYYWDGSGWQQLVTDAIPKWGTSGNSGTDPTTDYIGTSDAQDLVFRANDTEQVRVTSGGNVGIGESSPTNKLQVQGSVLFEGDFVNQQALGVHGSAPQNISYISGVLTPINDTNVSITVTDGSGVNNSAVFISGFARVFGGTLTGSASSMGAYFIVLQRDTDPTFATPVNVTYTAGSCFLSTPDGASAAAIGYGGGGHVSYMETGLTAGTTYYYRLVFFSNGVSITGGNYQVWERDLNVLQIKQ